MKYICVISLLCSFSSIIIAAETNWTNPWNLIAEIKQDDTIKSAYFNFQGTSIITCSDKAERIFDISSQKQVQYSSIKNQIVCLNPTEKFFIINDQFTIDGKPTSSIIYWPYKERTNYCPEFISWLPVTPHRCVMQKYGPQLELAGITIESTPSKPFGYWLNIHNIASNKDIIEYYHPYKINDFCFHPNRNIVASITSSPDPRIRILDTEKWHKFAERSYESELYSIRFDETGERLVVVNQNTIDVLDISNPTQFKMIMAIFNSEHSTQACLSGKWLAIATQSCIKLFDIEAKKERVDISGNNNLSPMSCFDFTGNVLLAINGKSVLVYKKTEPEKINSHAPLKQTALVTGSRESSDECSESPYQKQTLTVLASIYAFLESKFYNC